MKNLLLIAGVMFASALTATAQITINRSDLGNLIDARFIQAHDTTDLTALSPGSAGANQTWNLSGIGTDYRDTTPQFVLPAGTTCPEKFPTATFATIIPDETGMVRGNAYFYDDNSRMEVLGLCAAFNDINITLQYAPPQTTMTFPSTYNTTFSGQSKFRTQYPGLPPLIDSVRTNSTAFYSSVIDGWGTVVTPTGTYPCLRQKVVSNQLDSTYNLTGGKWEFSSVLLSDTTISYQWLGKGGMFSGVSMSTNAKGVVTGATYTISQLTVGVEEPVSQENPAVFPSPVDATLQWNITGDAAITDVLGRQVLELHPQLKSADVSGLAPGVYLLTIRTATGAVSHAFVKK